MESGPSPNSASSQTPSSGEGKEEYLKQKSQTLFDNLAKYIQGELSGDLSPPNSLSFEVCQILPLVLSFSIS